VPTVVVATPRAQQQIIALNRWDRRQVDAFVDDLARRGCAALAYRLSGPTPIDDVCLKHLGASLRVSVVFEAVDKAWITLVGTHNDNDAVVNIYNELCRLLGAEPENEAGRAKPPCCDQVKQRPPVLGDLVDDILASASQLRRTRRRR
jgi:hypothetical protein